MIEVNFRAPRGKFNVREDPDGKPFVEFRPHLTLAPDQVDALREYLNTNPCSLVWAIETGDPREWIGSDDHIRNWITLQVNHRISELITMLQTQGAAALAVECGDAGEAAANQEWLDECIQECREMVREFKQHPPAEVL